MNPIIILTYILNLVVLNNVFGFFGFFFALVISGGIFYFISKRGGPKMKHWGQIAALGFVHLAGFIAIANAPWGNVWITGVAIIMELFVFAIFSNMRR